MDLDVELFEQYDFLQDDLVCTVCYAEFLDKEDLEMHIRQLHLNETNRTKFCEFCTHIFHDIEEFSFHLRDNHLSNLKWCKYCNRLFKTTLELQEHEEKHNGGVLYPKVSCSHCASVFDKEDLKNHELKEHIDSTDGLLLKDCLSILSTTLCMNVHEFFCVPYSSLLYKCVVCDKSTADVSEYLQHLIDQKCHAYACNECCNVYPDKYKVMSHVTSKRSKCSAFVGKDNRNLKMKCQKCNMIFVESSLELHVKKCSGMCCNICNLQFKSLDEYSVHKLDKHETKLLSIEVCKYCQRHMVGREGLKRHIERVHKNDKHLYKYSCTVCSRVFKHPKLLFAHFYSNHKELHPYTCKICNKTFRVRKSFSVHIKLMHKSVGSVEFDENFHVFFINKKSDKLPKSQAVGLNFENNDHDYYCKVPCDNKHKDDSERKIEIEPIRNDSSDKHKIEQPTKEVIEIEFEPIDTDDANQKNTGSKNKNDDRKLIQKPVQNLKTSVLKQKQNLVNKSNIQDHQYDVSSDDSDLPLLSVSKKLKLKNYKMKKSCKRIHNKPAKKTKNKNFICESCNRNCYTYQNYHRHKAFHNQNETKVCIKCYGKFNSVKKLNEHIKKEHSSSQLTETLKKLIAKRKNAEARKKEVSKSKDVPKSEDILISEDALPEEELIPLSTTEKFLNTIKKVKTPRNTSTTVTMKLIEQDKISVKKYLESFIPDSNFVKITLLKDTDTARVKKLRPLIKLTKFSEPTQKYQERRLKMPVKFTDTLSETHKVSIKLVSDYKFPAMTFNSKTKRNFVENYDDYDIYDGNLEDKVDSKDAVPEVAQEVMLDGAEEQTNIVHSMSLKNIPSDHKVSIGHLSAEAPYFKISKLNLEGEHIYTSGNISNVDVETPKDIMLPSGKKLVSVNPFEHLLGKNVMDLIKIKKIKKGYKPRINNPAEAIKTALEKLEKSGSTKEKRKLQR